MSDNNLFAEINPTEEASLSGGHCYGGYRPYKKHGGYASAKASASAQAYGGGYAQASASASAQAYGGGYASANASASAFAG